MMTTVTTDLTGALGPVRDQGARSTCLAFALSDLHRHKHKKTEILSPEYLYRAAAALTAGWQPMRGLPVASGLAAVSSPGQPEEKHCPYQPNEPAELPPRVPSATYPLYTAPGLQALVSVPKLVALLQAGTPVGLVLQLSIAFFSPVNGVVAFPSPLAPTNAVHAVIAAGIGTEKSLGPCVLIRNSWGDAWGVNGNAWVPMTYVQQHGLSMFEVT